MRESQQGESYREYVIRQADTGAMFSVPERAGLRDLRRAKLNSRSTLNPRMFVNSTTDTRCSGSSS